MEKDKFGNNEIYSGQVKAPKNETLRIGLFGGTFNPIHHGHLRAAEEVREYFHLHKVIFIPARIPPHKNNEPIVAPEHRLKMVRLAIRDNSAFGVSDFEIKRDSTSYSIFTIEYFRKKFGLQVSLFFLMGMDAFIEISTWKDFSRLFSLADFIIMARPGYPKKEISQLLPVDVAKDFYYNFEDNCYVHLSEHKIFFQEITLLDISSCSIRDRMRKHLSVHYLVLPEIERYIKKNNLYLN